MTDFDLSAHYDELLKEQMDRATDPDLSEEEAAARMKNLKVFSECRPPQPKQEPTPVVPTTRWEKFRAEAAAALDNETTRAIIKAGGALAGVGIVAWSTIHKDHVLERQSLQQANQRPS